VFVEQGDQLREVEERPAQAVNFVDNDRVDLPGFNVGQQPLERRAVHVAAGEAAIVIAVGQADPALGLLAGDVGLDEITAQTVMDYFSGKTVVQVDKGGFKEPAPVPKASTEVVDAAIEGAVAAGKVWLLLGPASLLSQPIPAGVLAPSSKLRTPPAPIAAAAILPENLPNAWKDGSTTALSIAAALSQQAGNTLPWKTVRDVIGGSLQARFVALADDSGQWPCDLPAANAVKIKVAAAGTGGGTGGGAGGGGATPPNIRIAAADFEPSQIQDLGDLVPALLDIKAKANVAMKFHVQLDIGDGTTRRE
jgi:hypothetical protein